MAVKGLMKIGDAAAAIGVTTQTLRYYEDLGLLAPCRTQGGTRLYSPADVDRLRAIQRLVRLETPLSTLSRLAQARKTSPSGDAASHTVYETLAASVAAIREKRRQLEELEAELVAAMNVVRQCFGCARPPRGEICSGCPVAEQPRPPVLRDMVWPEGG